MTLSMTMSMNVAGMCALVDFGNLMHLVFVDGPATGMPIHRPLLVFDALSFVEELPSTRHYTTQDATGRSWGIWPLDGKLVTFRPGSQLLPPSHLRGDLDQVAKIDRASPGAGAILNDHLSPSGSARVSARVELSLGKTAVDQASTVELEFAPVRTSDGTAYRDRFALRVRSELTAEVPEKRPWIEIHATPFGGGTPRRLRLANDHLIETSLTNLPAIPESFHHFQGFYQLSAVAPTLKSGENPPTPRALKEGGIRTGCVLAEMSK